MGLPGRGLAERHGLVPLLYRHLEAIDPTASPKPIFARLWSQSQATAGRNLMLTQELLRLLDLLAANDIPAIPYKGPALAALVYGDISLRPFNDLDILVPQRAARRAKALLEANGYHYPDRLTEAQEVA
ncbi:MAG: nucleotidyltransferase family protein, partial [Anaerolineae bacterium]|nr:nucleotidyltransferase family protein [Anaerolineae bacterium]